MDEIDREEIVLNLHFYRNYLARPDILFTDMLCAVAQIKYLEKRLAEADEMPLAIGHDSALVMELEAEDGR